MLLSLHPINNEDFLRLIEFSKLFKIENFTVLGNVYPQETNENILLFSLLSIKDLLFLYFSSSLFFTEKKLKFSFNFVYSLIFSNLILVSILYINNPEDFKDYIVLTFTITLLVFSLTLIRETKKSYIDVLNSFENTSLYTIFIFLTIPLLLIINFILDIDLKDLLICCFSIIYGFSFRNNINNNFSKKNKITKIFLCIVFVILAPIIFLYVTKNTALFVSFFSFLILMIYNIQYKTIKYDKFYKDVLENLSPPEEKHFEKYEIYNELIVDNIIKKLTKISNDYKNDEKEKVSDIKNINYKYHKITHQLNSKVDLLITHLRTNYSIKEDYDLD